MPSFEESLATLVSSAGQPNSLPGAVLLASTSTSPSDIAYSHCVGNSSLDPGKARPLTEKSIFWIASCTKLMTSLAALQLVEAGKIALDTPVEEVLPELASLEVLEGWEKEAPSHEGAVAKEKPRLRKAKNKIELRHLLTHTSGLGYEFINEDIQKWWAYKGINVMDVAGDIVRSYSTPLLFEPGSRWTYSPGLDWAGILIARISGEDDLQAYMRKHIWGPLGIDQKDMAFRQRDLGLSEHEMAERIVHLSLRKQGDQSLAPALPIRPMNPKDCYGGGGVLTCPEAYLKVLRSLLKNDGKILKPEALVKYMLEPQLVDGKVGTPAHDSLLYTLDTMLGGKMLTGGLPLPKEEGAPEYQHGLLGLLDRPKGTRDWTLSWGGLPNLFWHICPSTGICGIYASQVIPPGDPVSMDMAVRWRQELQKRFGRKAKSNL